MLGDNEFGTAVWTIHPPSRVLFLCFQLSAASGTEKAKFHSCSGFLLLAKVNALGQNCKAKLSYERYDITKAEGAVFRFNPLSPEL
jgi:hypothetical protein